MGIYGPNSAARVDIAAISAAMQGPTGDWYNATIQIVNPRIDEGAFNRLDNTKDRPAQTVLWTGPARIQAMRWPNVATARQEATAARTVVFHIPLDEALDPSLIVEGYRVRVTDGGLSPQFEHGLFVITATTNTSYAWDRRIETVMDQGAVIG
jgi:hypothetical protein